MLKNLADKIFKWFCHPDYYPDIKGDLEELYLERLSDKTRLSQLKYCADVLLLFRPSLVRPLFTNSFNSIDMFKNYLKIGIRQLLLRKGYSAINIFGLAIGLAAFLMIEEYVSFERSYDSYHDESENLYRIGTLEVLDGVIDVKDAMASYSTGSYLNESIPEIVDHTVTKTIDELILRNGDNIYHENKVISSDNRFLSHFNLKVIAGSEADFFKEPLSVVLTESQATKYFKDEDPIGKTLDVISPYDVPLQVTGVVEDVPLNTHYHFDMMISDITLKGVEDDYENWNYNNYYVYVRLQEGTDPQNLKSKLEELTRAKYGEETTSFWDIHLVKDIYLESDWTYEPEAMGDKRAVSFVGLISIFILAIAWINYVNLSTARAIDRAKEVGLRKVSGAKKFQLIGQFLFESFLINTLGAVLALGICEAIVPFFNNLLGKEIVTHVWQEPGIVNNLLVFLVLGSLLSGLYPSLVLSSFQPLTIITGKHRTSKTGTILRKGLVLTQFGASIILIGSTFIVYEQLQFMRDKDIGIDTDQVVTVTVPGSNAETEEEWNAYVQKFNSFKDELRSHSAVLVVGGTSNVPGGGPDDINSTTSSIGIAGRNDPPLGGTTYAAYVDDYFVDAMGMTLIAGRDFDRKFATDEEAVMINESFLKRFDFTSAEEAIGEQIQFDYGDEPTRYTIIGVIKDFNRTSLKSAVEPTIYYPWINARHLVVKLGGVHWEDGLEYFESKWDEYYENVPFRYSFLDERFQALYEQDQKFGKVFAIFSILAIIVATLGLFGLAAFLSIQRSKEVGVRKVLGASTMNILGIFYSGFFRLILISGLVASPIIFFGMNSWLDNFAYRISFPWLFVALSLILVMICAFVTVGFQVLKIARLNPAQTLRYE